MCFTFQVNNEKALNETVPQAKLQNSQVFDLYQQARSFAKINPEKIYQVGITKSEKGFIVRFYGKDDIVNPLVPAVEVIDGKTRQVPSTSALTSGEARFELASGPILGAQAGGSLSIQVSQPKVVLIGDFPEAYYKATGEISEDLVICNHNPFQNPESNGAVVKESGPDKPDIIATLATWNKIIDDACITHLPVCTYIFAVNCKNEFLQSIINPENPVNLSIKGGKFNPNVKFYDRQTGEELRFQPYSAPKTEGQGTVTGAFFPAKQKSNSKEYVKYYSTGNTVPNEVEARATTVITNGDEGAPRFFSRTIESDKVEHKTDKTWSVKKAFQNKDLKLVEVERAKKPSTHLVDPESPYYNDLSAPVPFVRESDNKQGYVPVSKDISSETVEFSFPALLESMEKYKDKFGVYPSLTLFGYENESQQGKLVENYLQNLAANSNGAITYISALPSKLSDPSMGVTNTVNQELKKLRPPEYLVQVPDKEKPTEFN
jgi:hypothetical protein